MSSLHLPSLKLISIHIPKTAGTSFRNILNDVYGKESVLRVDITEYDELEYYCNINEIPRAKAKIHAEKVQVLHGHFQLSKIQQVFSWNIDVPVITWIRDPVSRVVSNYLYLKKILSGKLNSKYTDAKLLSELMVDLKQFAIRDINRNRATRFLENKAPGEFAFVGRTESFDKDLMQLKHIMGWGDLTLYHHNNTGYESNPELSEEIEELIAINNAEDIRFYKSIEK